DADVPVTRVLDAIDFANDAGLAPVKIDVVVKRGANDREVVAIAERFRHTPNIVRFIEYMDVGTTNEWQSGAVVPAAEIIERIAAVHPLEPIAATIRGEVARRWRYTDGGGEIGVIASVTQPFCTDCTRARVTATGELFTCLFAARGRDLRGLLRAGASDAELVDLIVGVWHARTDRYSEQRSADHQSGRRAEMSYLGG
ncbi:MAG: hypothetical protein JO246_11615, partial [Frankiaceae bacterium]|nr:hypothetical protein [Frankiaceae bacterium]